MKRRLELATDARDDLASIRTWLIREAGRSVSARVIAAIRKRIAGLLDWPEIGTLRPEFGGVRFVTSNNYVIYYEVDQSAVRILRVLHAARDRESLLSDRS